MSNGISDSEVWFHSLRSTKITNEWFHFEKKRDENPLQYFLENIAMLPFRRKVGGGRTIEFLISFVIHHMTFLPHDRFIRSNKRLK